MESNPKKSRAFIITFVAVIILLITAYLLFSHKDQLFGTKASTVTNKNFASLNATNKNNPLTTINGVSFATDQQNTKITAEAGEDISKCDAVYISGVNKNGQPIVMKAIANDKKKSEVLGIATVDIPKGSTGAIATSGTVSGMPQSCVSGNGLANNSPLYLSDTIAGKLSTNAPAATSVSVIVGTASNLNSKNQTFDIILGNSRYITVVAGENLAKNDSVYIAGVTPNGIPIVKKADPNDPSKHNILGIALDAIANGATGTVLLGGQKDSNLVNVQGGQNITNGQSVYFSGTNADGLPIAFVTIPSDPAKQVSVGTAVGDIPYFQLGTVLLNANGTTGGTAGNTNAVNGSVNGTGNGAGATFLDKLSNVASSIGNGIGNFFGSLFGGGSGNTTGSNGTSNGGLGSGTNTGGNGSTGGNGFGTTNGNGGTGTGGTGGFTTGGNNGSNGTETGGGFGTTGSNGTGSTGANGGFGTTGGTGTGTTGAGGGFESGTGTGSGGFGDNGGFGTGGFGTSGNFGTGGFGGGGFGTGSSSGLNPLPTPTGTGSSSSTSTGSSTGGTSTCTDASGNTIPCPTTTTPVVVSAPEMCPSDDPLVFTADEQAQLAVLLKKYYLIAPTMKSDEDIKVISDDIFRNQSIIDQAASLIADCKAQKADPSYTGPQAVKDNPYYKYTPQPTSTSTGNRVIIGYFDPAGGDCDANGNPIASTDPFNNNSYNYGNPYDYTNRSNNQYGQGNSGMYHTCRPLYGQTSNTTVQKNPNSSNYLPDKTSEYMTKVQSNGGSPIPGTRYKHHPVLDYSEFENLFNVW